LRRIASGFAETSPGAAFGAPLISPVPGLQGSLPVAERLTADARGDQEILLTAAGAGSGAEQLYLTSRSASGAFTSPRLLGSAFQGAQSTMSSNGHFTVIWRAADRAQVMAVSGRAGAALGAVQQISTGPPEPDGDPPLLAETSRRKVLALWPVRSGTPQAAIVAVESTIGRRFSRPRRVSVGGRFIHGCDEPVLIVPDRAAGVLAVWSCVYHAHGSILEYSRWRP
jgi:hypothetical protein